MSGSSGMLATAGRLKLLRYETQGPRAILTIDDPERRNPMSLDTMAELVNGIRRATADDDVRVVVITGAGDKAFSAGGDLSGRFVDAPLADHSDRGRLAELFRALRRCGKPVIARVNGHAIAGGFGLAAACDIVIAVEGATFGTPELQIGLWPMMISAVLQRLIPQRVALDLMLTGRRLSAVEAQQMGIVSRVVPAEGLDAAVDETVARLLAVSPAALALGKHSFYAVEDMPLDAALDYLHAGLTTVAMTDDAAEGVAAFVEKRDAAWRGR
jgi:enoyl-CoA hydratase/carnithine racemase